MRSIRGDSARLAVRHLCSVPLRMTHQSSAIHLSHFMSLSASRRQARAWRSSSWSVSQLVKPAVWLESERNNILVSSPPAQDSANALWSLISSHWEQTSMTSLRLVIKFPWHARRSLWRFFFKKNTRSGLFLSWLILLAPNNFQITHTETQWVIIVNNALSE